MNALACSQLLLGLLEQRRSLSLGHTIRLALGLALVSLMRALVCLH